MKTNSFEADVYKEMFWEKMDDEPALRFQLIELIEARTLTELSARWGFSQRNSLIRYLRGPLRRRVNRVAGADAVRLLRSLTHGTTVALESTVEESGSPKIDAELSAISLQYSEGSAGFSDEEDIEEGGED